MKKISISIALIVLIGLGIWYLNVTVEIRTGNETPKTAGSAVPFSPFPPKTGSAAKTAPVANPDTNTGTSATILKTPVAPSATTPTETASPKNETVTVAIAKFLFTPSPLSIRKGTTVVWTNKDEATHTVSSDSGLFSSGSIIKNNSYSFTFVKTGTYPYICGFHPGMRGVVEVTD